MEIIIKIEDAENQIMKMDPGDDRFMVSIYAKVFDERNPHWLPDSEYNLTYLTMQQQYATQKLKNEGHIFLNEVSDDCRVEAPNDGKLYLPTLSKQ